MTTGYTIIRKHTGRMLSCVAMAVLMSVASCVDDDLFPRQETDGRIAFRVGAGGGLVTRAATESDSSAVATPTSMPLYLGSDTLRLSFSAEPNRGVVVGDKPRTRGIPFDSLSHKVDKFTVSAYHDDNRTSYFEKDEVTVTGDIGTTNHYWPSGSLSFGAYAITDSKETLIDPTWTVGEEGSLTGNFSYTLPTSDSKNDAKNEPDLVFAIKPDQTKEPTPVSLLFHHALSAIVFKVGKMPEGVTLQSIALVNVHSSGSCTVKDTTDFSDDVVFHWSSLGERKTYTQELGNQPAKEGEYFGKQEENNNEYTFLMLPQEMEEGKDSVKIQLKFSMGEEEHTWTHTLSGIVEKWKPDTRYVFTIGLPEEIDVEVTDEVSGSTKQNVQIQNTGISTGYIRAAIVGYWVDETSRKIVAPWSEEDGEGEFKKGDEWDTYWVKDEDGFYYYQQPVEHNQYTFPLFDTYTLNDEAIKQHPGQKLELSIVAQIILATEEVGEKWPPKGQQQ